MQDFIQAGAQLPARGYEPDPRRAERYTEQQFDASQREPTFSIGRVQYALPAPLTHLCCTSEILLLGLATQPPRLIRIDLVGRPDEDEPIDLPFTPVPPNQRTQQQAIHQLFTDPTGRHALVSTTAGELLYAFDGFPREQQTGRKRARPLNKLKGAVVESVGWNTQAAPTSASTHEILVGTSDGRILEAWIDGELESSNRPFSRSAHDRYAKVVLTVPERQPVRGLHFQVWQTRAGQKRRAAIIAATSTRIYQYVSPVGSGNDGDGLFENFAQVFRDAVPKSLELPADLRHSELHLWQPLREGATSATLEAARSLAWLTGPGIYHGQLAFSSQEAGDGVIESAQLLPYPARQAAESEGGAGVYDGRGGRDGLVHEVPISMALAEYHFVLLYEDRVRVIRALDDRLVYEEALALAPGEKMLRLAADPVKRTYWLFSDASIFELTVRDEDRDIWSVYLNRQAFDVAMKYAKTPRQRDLVASQKADLLFSQHRYVQAAELYAQTTRPFEKVVLRFVDRDERDALRNYLHSRLGHLRRGDVTQRLMLATWLVEIFLAKINHLEDAALAEGATEEAENIHVERSMLEEDMREFMRTYKDALDPRTTYDLVASHGRPEIMLHYAALIGDYERIVAHHVLEEEWQPALDALAKQDDPALVYRFAPVLLRHAPGATVELLVRQPSLDVLRLIPALLATPARADAARYLQYSIFQLHSGEPAVHNALLTLYGAADDEADLLRFLAISPEDPATGRPLYDLDYALRTCKARGWLQACVQLFSKMGLYESSVDLALALHNVELAKANADKPDDDDVLRKKLWLKIARHIVGEKHDIKAAMAFLESTDLLKIEDIMPFFPDFVVIDDFKEEICAALEGYAHQIERLKAEMNEATQSAEAIKQDLADLSQRFIVVDAAENCATCGLPLLTRQFYVFPCQHAFHADCLITEVTQHLSPRMLRRLLDLQSQLTPHDPTAALPTAERNKLIEALAAPAQSLVLAGQGFDQLRKLIIPDALIGGIIRSTRALGGGRASAGGGAGGSGDVETKQRRTKAEALRQELDDLLANSCVLCDLAVATLDRPFVAEGEVGI